MPLLLDAGTLLLQVSGAEVARTAVDDPPDIFNDLAQSLQIHVWESTLSSPRNLGPEGNHKNKTRSRPRDLDHPARPQMLGILAGGCCMRH